MFNLYHAQSSRRYFDRKYFYRKMRFLFAKLALCVPPFYCEYTHIAPRQNGGTHKASLANKKRILRLKYLRSKYRLDFGHDINRTYCTETHSYLGFNSANMLRNRCLLAVSCGKMWIFVEFRLEVKPSHAPFDHLCLLIMAMPMYACPLSNYGWTYDRQYCLATYNTCQKGCQ